jgi:IS5 family transposase
VLGTTGELADLPMQAVGDAARVARNARRVPAGSQAAGKLAKLVDELQITIQRTTKVIAQTCTRPAGQVPDCASRLVSLHDPDARPIVKGRLGKSVEFGYKAQVADNPDGIVLDYKVEVGNPPTRPLLAPAVKRIAARAGRVPAAVAADRNYGEAAVDEEVHTPWRATGRDPTQGPARACPPGNRAHPRVLAADEVAHRLCGRISYLKHRFSWDRTLMDRIDGANLERTGGVRPQLGQHQRPDRIQAGGVRPAAAARQRRPPRGAGPASPPAALTSWPPIASEAPATPYTFFRTN